MDVWKDTAPGGLEKKIDPNALMVMLFTSGTTGRSKAVMLAERNFFTVMQMHVAMGDGNRRKRNYSGIDAAEEKQPENSNDGGGNFAFNLGEVYSDDSIVYYLVEDPGDNPVSGVTCDETIYKIDPKVVKDEKCVTLFCVVSVICRPFVGWMLDNGKRKLILLIGIIGMLRVDSIQFFSWQDL